MEIKSNSLIAYYYKWMFRGSLANDFCTLFWNTLFSILLLPFTIPAFLASFVFGDDVFQYRNLIGKAFRGVVTYFVLLLVFCLGLATFEKMFGPAWKTWNFWPVLGASIFGILVIVSSFVLIIGGIIIMCAAGHYVYQWIKNLSRKKVIFNNFDEHGNKYEDHYFESRENKVVVMWNAIRNKYCTKIEWK